jgi:hypothetical protein
VELFSESLIHPLAAVEIVVLIVTHASNGMGAPHASNVPKAEVVPASVTVPYQRFVRGRHMADHGSSDVWPTMGKPRAQGKAEEMRGEGKGNLAAHPGNSIGRSMLRCVDLV